MDHIWLSKNCQNIDGFGRAGQIIGVFGRTRQNKKSKPRPGIDTLEWVSRKYRVSVESVEKLIATLPNITNLARQLRKVAICCIWVEQTSIIPIFSRNAR